MFLDLVKLMAKYNPMSHVKTSAMDSTTQKETN